MPINGYGESDAFWPPSPEWSCFSGRPPMIFSVAVIVWATIMYGTMSAASLSAWALCASRIWCMSASNCRLYASASACLRASSSGLVTLAIALSSSVSDAVNCSRFSSVSNCWHSRHTFLSSRWHSSAVGLAVERFSRLLRTMLLRNMHDLASLLQRVDTSFCSRSRSALTVSTSCCSWRTWSTRRSMSSSRGRCCRLQRPRWPFSLTHFSSRAQRTRTSGSGGGRRSTTNWSLSIGCCELLRSAPGACCCCIGGICCICW
mmetsp:Transcript_6988/g.17885  ORF Transcript_6988/g.17885 Transcript_6988/m.17885 type:complete len:261 (+) Transcript_6988:438-1220(+)